MANGMDYMVNALLKAAGFERAQLDAGMEQARSKATEYDQRFTALETNIGEILAILKKGNVNAADVPDAETPGI